MASTYNSTSTSLDAQPHCSLEISGASDLDNNHLPTPTFDSTLLSPFDFSQTFSRSTSPSININSTPGESLSEDSFDLPSELSEFDDEFFGVDFDAGVQRVDSIPFTLPSTVVFTQSVKPNHESLSETLDAPAYPPSPKLTTVPNTPSSKSEAFNPESKSPALRQESSAELHNLRSPPSAPSHPSTTGRLTPNHSGRSPTAATAVGPSTMAHSDDNVHLTGSQWGIPQPQPQPSTSLPSGQYGGASNPEIFGNQSPGQPLGQGLQATGLRDDEGIWRSNERTGQAGLDPESRRLIANEEVPSLKEQEEQRRIDSRNIEIQVWRSHAGQSDENLGQSSNTRRIDPEEGNHLPPLDDAASIHENRFIDGQVYFNDKNTTLTEDDKLLMSQPRHWNDAPSLPYSTTAALQPPTSNEAISKWRANADALSMSSRVATWGTRRRSEPSLADMESIADGSFLKKLSIKPKETERPGSNSIFDQGLDRIANMVRNRSGSTIHKRGRSAQNIGEAQYNSPGNLAAVPPPRSPKFGRRSTPSINTAVARMAGPLAAVGTTHVHSGSVSATQASPKSPTPFGFARSMINRARSRSELSQQERPAQSGIVGLLRGQGGPPVANISSPPMEAEAKQQQGEPLDQDEDDDEDDEQADEGDVKIELNQESEPIVPNYDGFKAHIRRLNPDMDSTCNWLVSRIARQQEVRYKNLLELRVKHAQAVTAHTCLAGPFCVAHGGNVTLLNAQGNPRESEFSTAGAEFSDDSNPGEGALTEEIFPPGIPMPPARNLPAEFECQLCFKAKKFQKPSDWTKHVHEDVQPFTCTYEKCKEPKSFKRKADWVRHENERHRHLEWWTCEYEDCRRTCYRKDNFLQHLVREHKFPEPKQKTKAAIQQARSTERAWIMLERCRHESSMKPQDDPCKFCNKTFNTWKKLTVHLAKHMERISLPVLRLVEARNVGADTIISPVEQTLTPVTPTPVNRSNMESTTPFPMDDVSPHTLMVPRFPSAYNQSAYLSATASPATYGMHTPIPQQPAYDPIPMYPGVFGDETRAFDSLDLHGYGDVNQAGRGAPMGTGFPRTPARQYGGFDSDFSRSLSEQGYNTHRSPAYPMAQNYAAGSPTITPDYQTPNSLGITLPGYGFGSAPMNYSQGPQYVPMSRAQGSVSSYGRSPRNYPQNMPYYGPSS